MRRRALAVGVLGLVTSLNGAPAAQTPAIDVTVHEGTSMSVAVSPDGRTLAVDLQGSIWTIPAAGGAAKRITDLYNDARQPNWAPDGKSIAFFAYRDGGYDLWSIAPDGTNQRKLTWGAFDDREPSWSHDGTRVAFSSDRGNPLGSDYNIWTLDIRSGEFRQLTKAPSDDYMPSWSPDDTEIAFASARDEGQSVWAVSVADGTERKVSTAKGSRRRAVVGAWRPASSITSPRRARAASKSMAQPRPAARTCSRSARRGRRRPITGTCRTAGFAAAAPAPPRRRRSTSRRRCR